MRVAEFFNLVDTFNGLQTGEDVLWWTSDGRGEFKVNKAYKMMDQTNQQVQNGLGNKFGRVGYLTKFHALFG
uniref:Putative ovule protein n=1 Tax=Solanum chacoense TaxID=4108 RepID=A0A0V0GKZ6_SOLCH